MTSEKSEQREREAIAVVDDVAAEVAQSAIDIILSIDVLEHLPVVKGLVGAARSVATVRDKFLMRKIETFMRRLATVPQEARRNMLRHLQDDPAYTESVGEHLIELLDRLEGQRKAAIAGDAFAAFARETIDLTTLRRLLNAIDRLPAMEIDTVRRFVMSSNNPSERDGIDSESLQALANAGLASSVGTSPTGSRRTFIANATCLKFVELNLDVKDGPGP